MSLGYNDIHHNDIPQNDTHHNINNFAKYHNLSIKPIMLSVVMLMVVAL
jgi:hypothetical protein